MTHQGDLVVLAADKDIEQTLIGLLDRPQTPGIRAIDRDLFVHPQHDNGCRARGADFLRPLCRSYAHALVVFDLHGCGHEANGRIEVESEVETELSINGWGNRAEVVVIDPELEAWVWSDSAHVSRILGFGSNVSLKQWLIEQRFLQQGQGKPENPKDAFEAALRQSRIRKSPVIFQELASRVGLTRCTNPSFRKLLATLRTWFPAEPSR